MKCHSGVCQLYNFIPLVCLLVFETGSCCVTLAGFKLILLKSWDYRHVSPCPALVEECVRKMKCRKPRRSGMWEVKERQRWLEKRGH
jgi:hypothetical protein